MKGSRPAAMAEPVGCPPEVLPQYRSERVGPLRTDQASPTPAPSTVARQGQFSETSEQPASRLQQVVDFVVVGLLCRIIVWIIESPWLLLFATWRAVRRLSSVIAAQARARLRSPWSIVLSASASVLLLLFGVADGWPGDYYA